jgi:hypothetical protein
MVGLSRQVWVGSDVARLWPVRSVEVGVWLRLGEVWQVRLGRERPGKARLGQARLGR